MQEEKMPRRLKRFYRTKEENTNENYYDTNNYNASYDDPKFSKITTLPTMEYEDIDEKNINEIKKVEQQSLEEKLAMLEIEKFKKEKKRMPNKEEQDKLANSLYEQFKSNPTEERIDSEIRTRGRDRRRGRNKEENNKIEDSQPIESPVVSNTSDIKSLFEESDDLSKSKKKDEFDLGLDLDEGDDSDIESDLEELEDFSNKKKKKTN